MISLSVFRSLIVDRVKKFAPKQNQTLNMLTLMLDVVAGLAVLFLSAYTSVLASLPTP